MKKNKIIKKAKKAYPNLFTEQEILKWIFEIENVIRDVWKTESLSIEKELDEIKKELVKKDYLELLKHILIDAVISQICFSYVCIRMNLFLRKIKQYDQHIKKFNSLMKLLEKLAYAKPPDIREVR